MRLAILIDAESVEADMLSQIKSKLAYIKDQPVVRLFGDFRHNRRSKWVEIAFQNGFEIISVLPGRNAADIQLTIHALDLMYRREVETICIVSNDHGFLPLAQRLRVGGIDVLAMGSVSQSGVKRAYTKVIDLKSVPTTVAPPGVTNLTTKAA